MQTKTINQKMLIPGGEMYITSFTVDVPTKVKDSMTGNLPTPIELKDGGKISTSFDVDLYDSFLNTLHGYAAGNECERHSLVNLSYDCEARRYEVELRTKRPIDLTSLQATVASHFSKVQKVIESERSAKLR